MAIVDIHTCFRAIEVDREKAIAVHIEVTLVVWLHLFPCVSMSWRVGVIFLRSHPSPMWVCMRKPK